MSYIGYKGQPLDFMVYQDGEKGTSVEKVTRYYTLAAEPPATPQGLPRDADTKVLYRTFTENGVEWSKAAPEYTDEAKEKNYTYYESAITIYNDNSYVWSDPESQSILNIDFIKSIAVTTDQLYAFEVASKKVEVQDSSNNIIFKADGRDIDETGENGPASDGDRVQIGGFTVDNHTLSSGSLSTENLIQLSTASGYDITEVSIDELKSLTRSGVSSAVLTDLVLDDLTNTQSFSKQWFTDSRGFINNNNNLNNLSAIKLSFNKNYPSNVEIKALVESNNELDVRNLPESGGLEFEFSGNENEDTYTIVGIGDCTDSTIKIPASYNGAPVIAIGEEAFKGNTSITTVIIPDSVITISSSAFQDCVNLSNVSIGNNVAFIGSSAFEGCSGLTSVVIPNCVTSIGYSAFYKCSSLTSVIIPEGVTSIGDYAFAWCRSLPSVVIPNSVTSIGTSAFWDCRRLTSVIVPDSVKSIGSSAFSDCSGLTEITLPFVGAALNGTNNTYFGYIFGAVRYSYNNSYVPTLLKKVNITSASSIGEYAFYGCSSLTSVTLPNSISSISSSAFSSCSSLTSVTLPNSISSISSSAFSSCSSLTSVVIPDSVTSIGSYVFNGCSSLTSITIPDSVTFIGPYAFANCSSLTSVVIPDGVTEISSHAFSGCSGLKEITLPFIGAKAEVTAYYQYPLGWIFGTTSYTDSIATTQYYYGTSSSSTSSSRYYIPASLRKVTITNGTRINKNGTVTSSNNILFGAFYNCSGLTSVVIGDSVTSIGSSAFYNCSELTSINIPDSVETIGEQAFYGCGNVTSIKFSNKIRTLGSRVFEDTTELTCVYYKGTQTEWNTLLSTCNEDTKSILTNLTTYYYNQTEVSGSEPVGYWYYYPNSNQSSKPIVKWNDTAQLDSSSGLYFLPINMDTEYMVWGQHESSTSEKVEIPSTWHDKPVTIIRKDAFLGCTNIQSLVVPSSVIEICDNAFGNCSQLSSLTLPFIGNLKSGGYSHLGSIFGSLQDNSAVPESLKLLNLEVNSTITKIASDAFSGCENLQTILLPASLTHIEEGAFQGCFELASLQIPESIISIGDYAFEECESLETITLLNNLITLGVGVFKNCSNLTSLVLPQTLQAIPKELCFGCKALTEISLPKCVTTVKESAFAWCEALKAINLPDGISNIEAYAFYNCSNLTKVTIPASIQYIDASPFENCSANLIIYLEENKRSSWHDNWDLREVDASSNPKFRHQVVSETTPTVFIGKQLNGTSELIFFANINKISVDSIQKGDSLYLLNYTPNWQKSSRFTSTIELKLDKAPRLAIGNNFKVFEDGSIAATKGTIGGWNLQQFKDFSTNTTNQILVNRTISSATQDDVETVSGNTVGLAALSNPEVSGPVFWAGTPEGCTPWEYDQKYGSNAFEQKTPFFVTAAGELCSTAGTIGCAKIDSKSLQIFTNREGEEQRLSYSLTPEGIQIEEGELSIGSVCFKNVETPEGRSQTITSTSGEYIIQNTDGSTLVSAIKLGGTPNTETSQSYVFKIYAKGIGSINSPKVEIWARETTGKTVLQSLPIYYCFWIASWSGTYSGTGNQNWQLTVPAGKSESNHFTISCSSDWPWDRWIYFKIGKNQSAPGCMAGGATGGPNICMSYYKNKDIDGDNGVAVTGTYEVTQYPTTNIIEFTGDLLPSISCEGTDEVGYNLGAAKSKWRDLHVGGTVYFQGGAVHSSDANLKNTIQLLTVDNRYESLYDSLQPVSYKFNDGTSGRTHTGLIAQELKQSILDAGLTTTDVAAYCEWEVEDKETKEKSTTCGIRYEEFIPLNIHEIQKLKKRVADQEVRITELEETIKNLKTE